MTKEKDYYSCYVGQDYGVPCLIARNGDQRNTLIINIYDAIRDANYNRAELIKRCENEFNNSWRELDSDGLDWLLSEIEDRLAGKETEK